MIILRKYKVGSTAVIIAASLSGEKNGINQIYTTAHSYRPSRISVFYNGQALHSPDDFTESGHNEVTLLYVKPDSTDELRANYEINDSCTVSGTPCISEEDHDGIAHYFIALADTPDAYTGSAGGFVVVNSTETGLEFTTTSGIIDNFLGLVDTPTTYSGGEGKNVVVKGDGTGLEFDGLEKNGIEPIGNGAPSVSVTFANAFSSANYTVTLGLENTTDLQPSIYSVLVTNKLTTGFTVLFSGDIDSSGYKLNWSAKI